MRPSTVLVRVRLMKPMVEHLDAIGRHVSAKLARKVPRAAVIRAAINLVAGEMYSLDVAGLDKLFLLDPVRRGPSCAAIAKVRRSR